MPQTYVMITGAWHGGWAWRPVAQHLRASGHTVLAPTLPGLRDGDDPAGHRLPDVVDFVVDFVERRDLADVTLVGHSWGGYPLTGAANRLGSRIRQAVYWSAFVPAEDRSLMDEVPPAYQELFTGVAAASGNDTVTLPFAVWQDAFMADAPEPVQRQIYDLLVPQPLQYFTATIDTLHPDIPRSYLLGEDDVAMPPGDYGWAPRFPERLGVLPVYTPGSHEACFTRPAELANAMLKV